MSDNISPDPKETAPLQMALVDTPPLRKRKTFLKHKYADAITIREMDKDRGSARITRIPATLQAGRARMLIIATKMMDRMERRLDMLSDADSQMSTKEYKEFADSIGKVDEIMKDAFGVISTQPAQQPVNNGVIIQGVPSSDLSAMAARVAAAASRKQPTPIDITNDTGAAQPD